MISEQAFYDLLLLIDNCANFKNGIDYMGTDEGEVLAHTYLENICQNYFKKSYSKLIHDLQTQYKIPYIKIIKNIIKKKEE